MPVWVAVALTAIFAGFLGWMIGWLGASRQCCAIRENSVQRCEGGADPRCHGRNCTKHCLELCGCVRIAVHEQEDRRAAVDLHFLTDKRLK